MKTFIIFGMGRTGSSLLISLLDSHPRIHCDGEIFRRMRWRRPFRLLALLWRHYPIPYIHYRRVKAGLRESIDAYGFKLLIYPSGDQLADTFGFLHWAFHHNWTIIHLQRESLFDQALSDEMGYQTRRYLHHIRKVEPALPLTIPIDGFRARLRQTSERRQLNRQHLAGFAHITVMYEEDLAHETCWQPTVNRICDALRISRPDHVSTPLKKTWNRPYDELITNYAELKEVADDIKQ